MIILVCNSILRGLLKTGFLVRNPKFGPVHTKLATKMGKYPGMSKRFEALIPINVDNLTLISLLK